MNSRKLGLWLVRAALCAAAIWYLATHVEWHDSVYLADEKNTPLRLVSIDGEATHVLDHGQPRTIPTAQLRHVEGSGELEIGYGIPTLLRRANHSQALLAILIFMPVPLLSAVRLVWMLRVQGVRIPFLNSVRLTFAGNFLNFALPGTTGGDIYKAYYITRYTHLKTEAVTTIFLDRVVGLLSLVLMAAAMIPFNWDAQRFGRLAIAIGIILAALAVGGVLVFSRRLRHRIRLPALAARLPAGEQILRIGRATVAMRDHKSLVLASLMLTFVLQTVVMISAWVMSLALGMEGGFARYFIGVSIGFVIAAIPISPPQALGVLETAYIQFFARAGLNTAAQAVALALAVRVIQLVWALPGILDLLVGRHVPRAAELERLDEMASPAGRGGSPAAGPSAGATTAGSR